MRIRWLVGAGVVVVLAGAVATPRAEALSCGRPPVSVSPAVAAPGTTVLVGSTGYGSECMATTDVEVVVRVGDREQAAGRIRLGADHDFLVDVHVPPSLGRGTGAVVVRSTSGGATLAEAPLTVDGSIGDLDDRPYFEVDRRPSDSVWWFWLGAGALAGLVVGAALTRRGST